MLVAINHYSKWREAKVVMDQDAKIVAIFLDCEVISKFVVPKYILTDNGIEWFIEFDKLCNNCGIAH